MADQNDLVGQTQGSLFGIAEDRLQAPVQTFTPDPEAVRQRLNALLNTIREARAMPWSERDGRMWQTVFPQMANWLPDDEANQLRFAYLPPEPYSFCHRFKRQTLTEWVDL